MQKSNIQQTIKKITKKILAFIKESAKETWQFIKSFFYELWMLLCKIFQFCQKRWQAKQKQQQLQYQIQAKENECAIARQIMVVFAEQIAPAFYNQKYAFLHRISAPENMRLENYSYNNNAWLLRYSFEKSCDIPIPQQDLKELKQKLAQDMNRYMCELQLYKPIEIIQMNYFLILNNPIIIDILDDNPKRKVYIDIQLFYNSH